MKLISNWRDALRMHSVQIFCLIGALPVMWVQLPHSAQLWLSSLVPSDYHGFIITAVSLIGIWLRLKDQGIQTHSGEDQ